MNTFSRLYQRLDQTTKTNEKLKALVEFFHESTDKDRLTAVALLSHRRPKRPVKTSDLRLWASESADIPLWLLEDTYHIMGDLAETLAQVIPDQTTSINTQPLYQWVDRIRTIHGAAEDEKKEFILNSWSQLNKNERFVFNKIITGAFRIGVSDKLITKAVAQYLDQDPAHIAHRMMGKWTADTTTWEDLFLKENPEDNLSRPYPFYLAYALDISFDQLGDIAEWSAEYKWDGIRGQVIIRDDHLFVWSRGEDLVTEQYPEFDLFKSALPDGTVLDGEILAYDGEKPLAFGQLQRRLGRKKVGKKLLQEVPIILMAYDLLEYHGEDIRSKTFKERRALLQDLLAGVSEDIPIKLSPSVTFNSWEALDILRGQARKSHSEGFMLKKWESIYQVGRKRGDWWKWKVDPFSIDVVMMYAQSGHGRRANLFTDYTFGVWKDDILVPVAKAYSGLTDKEFKQVDRWIKQNTIERFGPVRSVPPELVFEIHFEDINKSSRHKSGIALRFPRMHRWRQDKPATEADTLEGLMELLENKDI